MIHLISELNAHLYTAYLSQMHSERRQQFIVERGWDLAVRDGGEYDIYDDDQALYLLGLDPDGCMEVGCRLRPTLTGGVIPDVFPHLIAPSESSTRTPGAYECTRYFTTAAARGRKGFEARSRLHLAMVEAVRDRGGHRLLGFADLPLLTHLRRFSGLRIRPVGLPAPYDETGAVTVAFEIGVKPDDLQETRRRLEIPTRQLFEAPGWLPEGFDIVALEQATSALVEADDEPRQTLKRAARNASRVVHHADVDAVMARISARAA